MNGNNGLSRARLRSTLRAYRAPAPIPQDVGPVADGDTIITVAGLNINRDTQIVLVPDDADPDVTTATPGAPTVVPSRVNELGTVTATFTFAGVVPAQANAFRIYLTGPLGQREYVGNINT